MKTSYLVNRSARVILGFIVLLGIGFVSSTNGQRNRNWDGYPNWGGSYDLRQTALNAGYNEGSKEGRNDRDRNRHNDYSGFTAYRNATKDYSSRLGRNDRKRGRRSNYRDFSAYQNATQDYSSKLGDRELYRRYYREGFENGYEDGWNGY